MNLEELSPEDRRRLWLDLAETIMSLPSAVLGQVDTVANRLQTENGLVVPLSCQMTIDPKFISGYLEMLRQKSRREGASE